MKRERISIILFILLFLASLFLSDFRLNLLGKYLSIAIVVLAIDLIWGYCGILSLGHAVYFGLGGYCIGAFLKLQSEALPDFMVWCGRTELPWLWQPFRHIWIALPMIIILPIILSLLIGIPTFRIGIKGVYFSILTQAMSLIFVTLFIGQQAFSGGTNGITNIQDIFGFSLTEPRTMLILYLVTVFFLLIIYYFFTWMIRGQFGKILVAIRDGENRLKFLGYNTAVFKIFIYAVSAGVSGLAGALFFLQVGIVSPSMMGILPSVEMAICVAVGGRGTLIGAIIGAVFVNGAKSYFSETFPEMWLYFFGILFISSVILFPKGILGFIRKKD